jgi:predicted nucleic acid-binding protein
MSVLVDSSVWIEFFRSRTRLDSTALGALARFIERDQAVTILPIEVEVLSGHPSPRVERTIREAFAALRHVDLDWNASTTWQHLSALGAHARASALPVPGVVDRMVVAAAQAAGAALWTLDVGMQRLARLERIHVR